MQERMFPDASPSHFQAGKSDDEEWIRRENSTLQTNAGNHSAGQSFEAATCSNSSRGAQELLFAQSLHGVYAGGSQSWNVASQQRRAQEYRCHRPNRERIHDAHIGKHAVHHATYKIRAA
jgi:hypothetical protein